MRADRLLGILLTLDRKRKVTAWDLAKEFEVSERTIYRDINALLIDFPIVAEAGPEGGRGRPETRPGRGESIHGS